MSSTKNRLYPTLPLRDLVVFPTMIFPLFVGRDNSVNAVEEAMAHDKKIFLITQKNPTDEIVDIDNIYNVGVVAKIVQLLKLPDGTLKILVETFERAQILSFLDNGALFTAEISPIKEVRSQISSEASLLVRKVTELFQKYVNLDDRLSVEILDSILDIYEPGKLADHVISSLPLPIVDKQAILEEINADIRLQKVHALLIAESEIIEADKQVRDRIKTQVDGNQKEYYLNEQLKAIKKELGDEGEEDKGEIHRFEKLISEVKLSVEAKERAMEELKKLKNMNPLSSEAGIVRSYLEWLLFIPWNNPSEVKYDLRVASDVLNSKHYGLHKVKERILEFIAVQKRVEKLRGPILCLVGPPGVGKTSLAKSIAESMGRKFAKISLGGVRDEAEIRGHRRTYIGAMPGKIIQSMKKVKTSNPLILLDEIDKLGSDFRGDPASALLEVLDPEQNSVFNDHYLEVDYDLSNVMFITTANSLDIPHALLDRMEIIRLSGYTEEEKVEIALKYLIPKQIENHGLKKSEWSISRAALVALIRHYTYEAGVRNLERELANLTRKATKKIDSSSKIKNLSITTKNLSKYAGVQKYSFGKIEEEDLVGISTGLAYTQFGGDILPIEAARMPGDGKITFTGKLGDVMKESMQAAFSYFQSRSFEFGVLPKEYKKYNLHIHVPEGAIPKDGPSAGVAICTAIVSVMTGIAVKKDVAMTGEITLRGRVLPIGGLKEKLLAALRGGIKTVIIPAKNEKDLADIPANVKKSLKILFAENVDDALKAALVKMPKPIKWNPAMADLDDSRSESAPH
jgi:ATP-dependent Lon protease